MQLFIGLGNPGTQYAGNRHNIGFMTLDRIARDFRAPPWKKRFSGFATEAQIGKDRVILLKPETFMNLSGQAANEAIRFFKLDLNDVVVFHDELDLDPGVVRVKTGGGNAGHNGLRSISGICGNDYRRVRIGIGHPGDKSLVHGWVLSNFHKDEHQGVDDLCRALSDHAALLTDKQDTDYQARVNQAMG